MKKIYFLFVIILSACTNITPYPRDTLEFHQEMLALKNGKTTKEEIIKQVGEPDKKEVLGDKEIWVYWRQQLSIRRVPLYKHYTGKKVADSYYRLSFDNNGVMTGMGQMSIGYRNEPDAEKR